MRHFHYNEWGWNEMLNMAALGKVPPSSTNSQSTNNDSQLKNHEPLVSLFTCAEIEVTTDYFFSIFKHMKQMLW